MSVTIGYYFNVDEPLHEFAKALNKTVGCSLAPYEGDSTDFYCRFFGMEFSLGHSDLVTDRDLNFEEYRYFLDVRIPSPDNDLLPIATQSMLSVAYVLHARLGIHSGLLVWDVQRAIAKYQLRTNPQQQDAWFDAVTK